jgi:hypothetical protein
MSRINNNAVIVSTCNQRLQALKSQVPAKTEIPMNGSRHKPADLIAIYQATLDTRAALVKSRAQAKVDLAARRAAEANRDAIEPGLRAWVIAQFGATSNEAIEFGYGPPKTGAKSAETKANAVKLAAATREARGTKGKRQKKGIKGTLVAPTAPAAPAITTSVAPTITAPPPTDVAKTNGAQASASNGTAPTS